MKKNAMLKIAAILMVAVLLTTCAISSTFAKYVTTKDLTASARVAKWGVNVEVSASSSAFLSTYGTTLVVADEPVVAPGTSVGVKDNDDNNAIKIAISGKPEVKALVNCNNSETDLFIDFEGDWNVTTTSGTHEYCPIVFVINDTEYKFVDTIENFENALQDAIKDVFGATYAANATINEVLTIDWYWNFPELAADSSNADEVALADKCDTQLGDRAASGVNVPKFTFNFDITIEQDGPASADQ